MKPGRSLLALVSMVLSMPVHGAPVELAGASPASSPPALGQDRQGQSGRALSRAGHSQASQAGQEALGKGHPANGQPGRNAAARLASRHAGSGSGSSAPVLFRRMTEEERLETWGQDVRRKPQGPKCRAPATVAPCAAMGVASLKANGQPSVAEGNPVNPLTGQKYQVDLDAAALPGPLGLEIRRHYSSALGMLRQPLGRGWTFSYDTRVFLTRDTVQIIQPDGHRLMFQRPGPQAPAASHLPGQGAGSDGGGTGSRCTSDQPEHGTVVIRPDGGYRWQWPSGRELDFNRAGYLEMIREPAQGADNAASQPAPGWHRLHIRRDEAGRMLEVTDPAGRSMRFAYDQRGLLQHIDHPAGRWHYQHAPAGQLLSARAPDGARRIYRYDDPGFPSALTAIEMDAPALPRPKRIGAWRYDHLGRVVEYSGPQTVLAFAYEEADRQGVRRTVVTDRQGQRRIYRYREVAGEWQTLAVSGQDCPHCAPAERSFHYDASGRLAGIRDRLAEQADLPARWFRIEHDRFGRIGKIWRRVRLEAQPARTQRPGQDDDHWVLFRRYEYASDRSQLPSLVARPSVVPGREYTVAYRYRQIAGQERPVVIIESGYSHGERVVRGVTVDYDGQGRVRSIDGPLPGSRDRVDFRPGPMVQGRARAIMTDALGRVVQLEPSQGWLSSSLDWLMDNGRFYREAGQLRHLAGNGVEQQVIIDDFNRVTRTLSPDSGTETSFHDVADRVIRQVDATGAEVRIEYDDYSRPLRRTLRSGTGEEEHTSYRYEGSRLVEVQHPVATERYRHDAAGRLLEREAIVHPPGSSTRQRFVSRFVYAGSSALPVEEVLPNGAVIRRTLAAQAHTVSLLDPRSARASEPVLLYRRSWQGSATVASGLEQWQFGNGTQRQLQWGDGARLLAIEDWMPPEARSQHRHAGWQSPPATDAAAIRTPAAAGPAGGWAAGVLSAERLGYRADGRIATLASPGREQRFAYSQAGWLIIAEERATARAGMLPQQPSRTQPRRPAEPLLPVNALSQRPADQGASGQSERLSAAQSSRSMPDEGRAGTADFAWWYAYDDNGNRVFSGRHGMAVAAAPAAHAAALPKLPHSGSSQGAEATEGVAAAFGPGNNRYRDVPYDAAGRPLRWQDWTLEWHPGGQIARMKQAGGRVLRYFYNHRGERVAREENGQWSLFDYRNGKLQAEVSPAHPQMRVWWYEGEIPAVVIDGRADGRRGGSPYRLYWLHVGHHGMPLAMSDQQGRLVWQGRYGPFGEPVPEAATHLQRDNQSNSQSRGWGWGRARSASAARLEGTAAGGRRADAASASAGGRMVNNDPRLRFPGQWADPLTGLYYNLARDYDPATGRYLSPDPLGLRAGPNPYLYVNANPVRHVDPSGLLLFAFDGTFNASEDQTNIWRFARLYQHEGNGPSPFAGHRPYLAGVGIMGGADTAYRTDRSRVRDKTEGVVADYWRENVEYHFQQFRAAVNALQPGETLNIDVVGFSRGASQALEFGRLIARELRSGRLANSHQVNLRFMGLLDPVPTNMYDRDGLDDDTEAVFSALGTYQYDGRLELGNWEKRCNPMGVDNEWKHVVNILAAHDQREDLFSPGSLGSQVARSRPGAVRQEFALAGAHSDVGGGYGEDGDLSNVALWALLERAKDAGVVLGEMDDSSWKTVNKPTLHLEWTILDGKMNGRRILSDGRWQPPGASRIPGMALSLPEIWAAPEGGGDGQQPDAGGEDHHPLFDGPASSAGQGNRHRPLPRPGTVSSLIDGMAMQPVARYQVDMQKYCAYLLEQALLRRCPY